MQAMLGSPKIKSRSIPNQILLCPPNKVYDAAHVLQATVVNGTFINASFSEQIVYTTKRKDQRAKSNYCNHLKTTFNYSGGIAPSFVTSVSPPGWTQEYYSQHKACADAMPSVVNAVDIALSQTKGGVLGGGGQAFINSAWDTLRPDLRSVSIPNFLADIADLKTLFKLWKESLSVAKNIAGAHLNYKFGWKPTVGDLSDMIKGVKQLRSKLAAFKASLGSLRQDSTGITLGLPTSATGSLALAGHSVDYYASCTRKCQAFVAWRPEPLAVMGALDEVLRGLLDTLGFELNPRIIWDALPFTFVLDWFFDVGSFLDRYRVDALELPVSLVDSFVQYKEQLTIEWTWTRKNDGSFTSRPKSGGASYRRDFFHRVPIFPDYATLAGLGWKLPTLNQATLMLSLATVLKK